MVMRLICTQDKWVRFLQEALGMTGIDWQINLSDAGSVSIGNT